MGHRMTKETDKTKISKNMENSNTAVIGGGISGLAIAYWLSKSGTPVTLYEASDQLGGLGTFFNIAMFFLKNFTIVCYLAINIF